MTNSLKVPTEEKNQQGSFLIVALILIIVLSALGIASMSSVFSSLRVSQNYSKFMDAKIKAATMADYGLRILQTYQDGQYPGPATCNSTATCNVIDSTFPQNGRPTLAWTSGLGSAQLNSTSESDQWWTDHAFAYEATFAGSGNARVIVTLVGQNTHYPYEHTYKIVGYATDATGSARASSTLYYTWKGYRPDPGDGTCAGGCHYAQCCSNSNVCSSSQSDCEGGIATFVPPGWFCSDYFVTGLGYNASTCNNPIAKISDAVNYMQPTFDNLANLYNANGIFPNDFNFHGTTVTNSNGTAVDVAAPVNAYGVDLLTYNKGTNFYYLQFYLTDTYMLIGTNPGQTYPGDNVFRTATYIDSSGFFNFICGQEISGGDNDDINPVYMPVYCTCQDMAGAWTGGGSCIP